jgi:hypothetical protein
VEDDGHLAAEPVQMRFNDLKCKTDRNGGIEGIAALFQDPHAGGSAQPMRRGHDAEGAGDLRPGGERALAGIRPVAQPKISKRQISRHPCLEAFYELSTGLRQIERSGYTGG